MKKVLVIEDDPDFAQLMTLFLRGRYDVTTILNGAEALEWLAQESVDVVLLDIMLPGLSGLEIVRRMQCERQDSSKTPVVVMTAARLDKGTEALFLQEPNVKGYYEKMNAHVPFLPLVNQRIQQITAEA